MPTTFSPVALRPVLAQAPTPITAVAGLLDVSIQDTSTTWPRLREAGAIGISALAAEHSGIIRQLAGPAEKRFDGVAWSSDDSAVLLDGATATFTTRLVEEITTGDHTLAVLEVLDATSYAEQTPLVFHNSQFKPH
ncbi:flavin reductase family protein [Corynebacterium sp.]|uniref:flavin reductase family protein n=1 Tax=Corynebacterium sp. TaxID=1720 RepID=UPI0028A9EFA7|nr:flavin reductase family protein [Corynebacterium sp.]